MADIPWPRGAVVLVRGDLRGVEGAVGARRGVAPLTAPGRKGIRRRGNQLPRRGLVAPYPPATARRDASKGAGNVLPRFSALRKIPAHALGLNENRGGTRASKTADKEHPTAPLGDSEPARVQHSP